MRIQLLKMWDRARTSFWFVPSLMTTGAVALSFAAVRLDTMVTDEWLSRQSWAYTGGAESAGSVLSTIAGSMITIAGVVFSLTLVALSLASSQFGPRLLRNFMNDTTNQSVLGTFVATFLYCLLVLRTIRRPDEGDFVPHLAITLGLVFAVASLGVLIHFIHHVATSIQVDQIIGRVSAELSTSIDRLLPNELGAAEAQRETHEDMPQDFGGEWRAINALNEGYLQLIDTDGLLRIACENDLVIRIERSPGHYVLEDSALALTAPSASGAAMEEIGDAFVLGSRRNPAQDVEFSVHQLVEIALRALSPGVNDPFTALTCIDRLGSALHRLTRRELPCRYRRDEHGVVRLIAPPLSFEALLDAAMLQIRQHATDHPAVAIRLLETIAAIAPGARRTADRAALRRHAIMIERGVRTRTQEPHDLADVAQRFEAALAALK